MITIITVIIMMMMIIIMKNHACYAYRLQSICASISSLLVLVGRLRISIAIKVSNELGKLCNAESAAGLVTNSNADSAFVGIKAQC